MGVTASLTSILKISRFRSGKVLTTCRVATRVDVRHAEEIEDADTKCVRSYSRGIGGSEG